MSECEGIILSYRLGRKTQYPKEILVKVLQGDAPETGQMIGWNIAWPSKNPKIRGRIVGFHGEKVR
jgi:ribosomal protein L35AE/L33A